MSNRGIIIAGMDRICGQLARDKKRLRDAAEAGSVARKIIQKLG